MADINENGTARSTRRPISRAASRRSGASRGTSRPHLERVHTGTHLDFDHSQYAGHRYHDHHHDVETDDEDDSTSTDLSEKNEESEDEPADGIMPEVRDGIEDERDVDLEAAPKFERKKTSKSAKSIRDPNLVSWDGPSDPANPKNWSMGRKWAATLVGMSPCDE